MSQEPEMQERVEPLAPWRHDDGQSNALASFRFFFVSLVVVVLFLFLGMETKKQPKMGGKQFEVEVFFFKSRCSKFEVKILEITS